MLLDDLAKRIVALRVEDTVALETARLAILDTIGVALAGSSCDAVTAVARAVAAAGLADGPATWFGCARGIDILNAALINGTASHALDFDDCSNTLGGHPTAPVLAGLWAIAEARGASGTAVLDAYAAGVEVETRLGRAVNFHHYEKGWHPTSTLGTFGAAAAASRLAGLDAVRTAAALAIAASMAAGIKANFGTMTKPFHVGHCARSGLLAALLAEQGMTANEEALEHPQGFFAVFNGAGTFDAERLFDGWAEPLDLVEPGIAFKRHPCCASTHPAIDALLELRSRHGLTPDNVVAIRSWTHPRRLRHTDRSDPRDGLDGKFSVQYVLARALTAGVVGVGDFTDEAVHDPAIRRIMARIAAEPHPQARMDTTEHFFAQLFVTRDDGQTFEAYVDRPLGRDRQHPLPEGALEAKFRDCAGAVLESAATERLLDLLLRLETLPDLSEITTVVRAGLRTTRHGEPRCMSA